MVNAESAYVLITQAISSKGSDEPAVHDSEDENSHNHGTQIAKYHKPVHSECSDQGVGKKGEE